tara:strand:- start:5071 stop:5283 length:213 start_codon:yes stop_codon:yes gene_type:complete
MFPFLRNHDGDVRDVVRGFRFPFFCQFFILELFTNNKMGNEAKKKLFVAEKYFPLEIPLIKLISLNYDKK